MSPCLTDLPIEILLFVVENLNFQDVINLSRTSRALRFLERDDRSARKVVEAHLRFCREAQRGDKFASTLRRVAKRREAIASGTPYAVAVVAFANSFIYRNGNLCYTLDDTIRILDLHNSSAVEITVDTRLLIGQAVFKGQAHSLPSNALTILHYSDGIISCLCKVPGSWIWLIILVQNQYLIRSKPFVATEKMFVRNNADFVYYGTHSEIPMSRHKRWVIQGFDIRGKKWLENKVYLRDMIGSEIGSTVSFEIHNGYFYAVSNQTTEEVEEVDWSSFYHCYRFPLDMPSMSKLEKTIDKQMWRRQHLEGPLEDRWTSINLKVNETTGELQIEEIRKEWLHGCRIPRRTRYTTNINFSRDSADQDWQLFLAAPALSRTSSNHMSHIESPSISLPATSISSSTSYEHTALTSFTPTPSPPPSTAYFQGLTKFDLAALTKDRLALTLTSRDKPHYCPAQTRLPRNVHTENVTSSTPTFLLSRMPVRSYSSSAETFLDLVSDTLNSNQKSNLRLRIRTSSRKINPLQVDENFLLPPTPVDEMTGKAMEGLHDSYSPSDIGFWPPETHHSNTGRDSWLSDLHDILSPPNYAGDVEGVADERSLVYATGCKTQERAVVFVSFDAGIVLDGLKKWGGDRVVSGLRERGSGDSSVTCTRKDKIGAIAGEKNTGEIENPRTNGHPDSITIEEKVFRDTSKLPPIGKPEATKSPHNYLLWTEPAIYTKVKRGFFFGLQALV